MALLVAFAQLGTARFTVEVVDEQTRIPMRGVNVTACFTSRYLRWDSKASVDTDQFAQTDKNGRCRFSGTTNCGDAWVRVMNHAGYYDSEILKIPYTNANRTVCRPVWEPDNMVVTLKLQRVEHPIPLFVKYARRRVMQKDLSANGYRLKYDLRFGDWLPPFGNGRVGDMEFDFSKVDVLRRYGEQVNYDAVPDNCKAQLTFPDSLNGIRWMGARRQTLKIRTAPESGYESVSEVGIKKFRNWGDIEPANPENNFCFRIRTKLDGNGNIVEANFGKIYGDIDVILNVGRENKVGIAVRFRYYLNPTSLDRNLEWDTKNNLNPVKPLAIDGYFTP